MSDEDMYDAYEDGYQEGYKKGYKKGLEDLTDIIFDCMNKFINLHVK